LTETSVKEQYQHIHPYHPEKFVVAEHSINVGHRIQLQNTIILMKKMRQMDQILREAIEIELHLDTVNREDGFTLSWTWKPLICDLKEQRQFHAKVSAPSSGRWKGLTSSVLHSLHFPHLPFPLLIPP
jgi:hypothetical protein